MTFAKLRAAARQIRKRITRPSVRDVSYVVRHQSDVPALRCGIVGMGLMGRTHAEVLRQHPYFKLTAVASRSPNTRNIADAYACQLFESAEAMFASGLIDLVVVAVPHWQHAELAISALRSGRHVVCEKPLAVTVAQADLMLQTAKESKRILTAVFQSRFEPVYQRAKAIIASGELGSINRCEFVEAFWRSNAYYRSGQWRATWKGEGGGVLINQAAHTLDRYIWLSGMPETVCGFCDTALHPIEVEDTASALMRHEGGRRHGYLHVNTTECPELARTTIACDRGRIVVENGRMTVWHLKESIRAKTASSDELFGSIESWRTDGDERLIDSAHDLLMRMYENIALAIAGRQQLLITAEDAAKAVELSNAILMSSATGREVRLPINRSAFEDFMRAKTGDDIPVTMKSA